MVRQVEQLELRAQPSEIARVVVEPADERVERKSPPRGPSWQRQPPRHGRSLIKWQQKSVASIPGHRHETGRLVIRDLTSCSATNFMLGDPLQEVGYNCHPNGHAFYLGRAARER